MIDSLLVIGAGRMGQRHLMGARGAVRAIDVVEPNETARKETLARAAGAHLRVYESLDALPDDRRYEAAILASTAAGRLEQLLEVLRRRVSQVLVEKPIEQSRARMRAFIAATAEFPGAVWCNHYRRTLAGFDPVRREGGPLYITVSSGAMGLGCNGIHWIDFALHLTGQNSGTLLFGEIDPTPIGSGRGATFRDYGGRGLFGFPDGSRLFLSSAPGSSAPTAISIMSSTRHWLVDQQTDRALLHERAPEVSHPAYLYGKDYSFRQRSGLEATDLAALTTQWLTCVAAHTAPPQPPILETQPAYELLFDLLESGGEREFRFT